MVASKLKLIVMRCQLRLRKISKLSVTNSKLASELCYLIHFKSKLVELQCVPITMQAIIFMIFHDLFLLVSLWE